MRVVVPLLHLDNELDGRVIEEVQEMECAEVRLVPPESYRFRRLVLLRYLTETCFSESAGFRYRILPRPRWGVRRNSRGC